MIYKIVDLQNTYKYENSFNLDYHSKYLNTFGEEIKHNFRSERFKNFICLGFNKDDNGRYQNADWFHKDDLLLEDELLQRLKTSSKKLSEILNITGEDIDKTCKEAREECWK